MELETQVATTNDDDYAGHGGSSSSPIWCTLAVAAAVAFLLVLVHCCIRTQQGGASWMRGRCQGKASNEEHSSEDSRYVWSKVLAVTS